MMPLMPSPGSPKMMSTPQSWIMSTRISAAVIAIARLLSSRLAHLSLVVAKFLMAVHQAQAIMLAALVAALKGIAPINVRMEFPQKSQNLIVGATAHLPMERCFEAEPELYFVLLKVTPFSSVMLHLGVTRADPPLIPRRINAFRVMAIQNLARRFRLFVVLSENNHHRAALLERVFVNEDFVLRQSFGQGIFQTAARRGAANRSGHAQ